MRRISMVLAAAVTSAMLVVAVGALDAVGADTKTTQPQEDLTAQLAQCLRDRGVALPALTGAQLERWLATHQPPLAIARACKEAVAPMVAPDVHKPADAQADARKLVACLRAHGAAAPSAPADLKRWMFEHGGDATVARALEACNMAPPPSCGDKDGKGAAPAEGNKDGQA